MFEMNCLEHCFWLCIRQGCRRINLTKNLIVGTMKNILIASDLKQSYWINTNKLLVFKTHWTCINYSTSILLAKIYESILLNIVDIYWCYTKNHRGHKHINTETKVLPLSGMAIPQVQDDVVLHNDVLLWDEETAPANDEISFLFQESLTWKRPFE